MGKTYQWPGDWGAWDEFTQYRRPHPMLVEFRRSVPMGLLVGVLLILVAINLTFLGLWVPVQGLGTGVLVAAAGLAVFLLGRGTVVDGTREVVRRWWGWLYRPVLSSDVRFSTIQAIEIRRKLGPKVPDPTVGQDLHSTSSETAVGRSWSSPVRGSQRRGSWPRNSLSSSQRLSPISPASHSTSTSSFSEGTTNQIRLR